MLSESDCDRTRSCTVKPAALIRVMKLRIRPPSTVTPSPILVSEGSRLVLSQSAAILLHGPTMNTSAPEDSITKSDAAIGRSGRERTLVDEAALFFITPPGLTRGVSAGNRPHCHVPTIRQSAARGWSRTYRHPSTARP